MLRISGAFLIIISSVLIAISHNKLIFGKIGEIENKILFFTKLREKVAYDNYDLTSAMNDAAQTAAKEFSEQIRLACDRMKSNEYKSIFDAWKSSINGSGVFGGADNEIIGEFLKAADNGSGAAVVTAADNAISKLEKMAAEQKSNAGKNKKVYSSLWIYAGVFLVIILM